MIKYEDRGKRKKERKTILALIMYTALPRVVLITLIEYTVMAH